MIPQITALLLSCLVLVMVLANESQPPNTDGLNLLFILTDQQRFDAFGRAQEDLEVPIQNRIRTPHMDRLSRDGAYFRTAYTHCAVCVPARTSLLTGRTIQNTGVRTNWHAKPENLDSDVPGNDARRKIPALRTYDEILVRDRGYDAEYYGKWHAPYSKGFVYQNEVRMAGASRAWFGRYEADNTTRSYQLGMKLDYIRWLDDERGIPPAPDTLDDGQQRNSMSRRPYVADPLDSNFGSPPDTDGGKQVHMHGLDLVGDGNSITAYQGTTALDALDRLGRGSSSPFSLHVSFQMPHPPWVATRRYYEMYEPNDMELPVSLADDLNNSAYSSNRIEEGSAYLEPDNIQRWKATFFGTVAEVDEWVGALLSKLEDLGIANRTLVALSSDHGEMMGDHGMKGKGVFYEGSSRVPLVLRFPGRIPPGTVVDEPVTLLDLHATFLDYLEVVKDGDDWPEGYQSDGSSLRRFVDGTDDSDPFAVTMWNNTSEGTNTSTSPTFMLRKGSWKMMFPSSAAEEQIAMLFDLKEDPHEMNNLLGNKGMTAAEEVIGKAEHLTTLLGQYLSDTGHPEADAERQRQRGWRSLQFWVGDTNIRFRPVLSSGSRREWLYVGTSSGGGTVVVSEIIVEGGPFQLDWTSGTIAENEYRKIAITYSEPEHSTCASSLSSPSASLIIRHDAAGGGEKRVALTRPKECRTESPTIVNQHMSSTPSASPTESPAGRTPELFPTSTVSPTAKSPLSEEMGDNFETAAAPGASSSGYHAQNQPVQFYSCSWALVFILFTAHMYS